MSFCFLPDILSWHQKSVSYVQPVWVHLDPAEWALPEPLPAWALSPHVPCHSPSRPLQPGAWGLLSDQAVLQPLWATHEPGHLELLVQPQLQLSALQWLGLLWWHLEKDSDGENKQCYVKEWKQNECVFINNGENVNIPFPFCFFFSKC